jgi:hypothetical protein
MYKFPISDFLQFIHESGVANTHPLATLQILNAVSENYEKGLFSKEIAVNCADLSNLDDEKQVFRYAESQNVTPTEAYNDLSEAGVI